MVHEWRRRGAAGPKFVLVLAALALVVGAAAPGLLAQTPPPPPVQPPAAGQSSTPPQQAASAERMAPQPEASPADSDTISFSANRVESVIAKGSERTVLSGGAVVTTGSLEIKADRIELAGEDYNDVVCTGAVSVYDESKGFLVKAATLRYKRDVEVGLAESGVVVEDSKNEVVLKADWVRFDQKASLVDARIGVHILKKDFAVRAEFARFNRDTQNLQLSGQPVAVTEDGTVSADAIQGTASAEGLTFSGRVSGTITTKKKEGGGP